ncbi:MULTISPECIES: TrkH family potassium uptake protein [unclassified Leeuwenhoekiella]|uniref:TrkH family potassium uptake protein n=1 Tax=unclassified Leeuwenhoekiella TaxID=2615029 RepID=UPI000C425797|nr:MULTISPECIES: potassium transporter TrkG [unclassified Leeuwenhoekiella]MBA80509.1 ATPase [Leeuwenhoekiella sp.]
MNDTPAKSKFLKTIYRTAFILSLIGVFAFIIDFGYEQSSTIQRALNAFYLIILFLGIGATLTRYFAEHIKRRKQVVLFDYATIAVTLYIIAIHFFGQEAHRHLSFFYDDNWIKVAILLTFIREFAEQKVSYKKSALNPAQLFIVSFLGIILLGALLLMLPKATYEGISFLDALFTSTSAVCVTGLIVVDTGSYFTPFGQNIIVFLIQLGGLGILTFASYFSYFFKGVSSFENQVILSDMNNSKKIGEVFSTLKRILLITFSIEIVGAFLIFLSLKSKVLPELGDRIAFSIFHSISAFCNAGFSTLSNGLYDINYRYNYALQLTLIALFVFGGLGFPIVINVLRYLKYKIIKPILNRNQKIDYKPWLLSLSSRITLITTSSLLVIGTLLVYINEYSNTLAEHDGLGKFVTALFGAATPRTAGFNTVDMNQLHFSTLMLIFLLMWVGASPASTGGGIKTSTFAIATLNFFSLAKGKTRIEVYRREIADISVRRAFAIISLSLVVIGFAVIAISSFDSQKTLLSIAFECFSAYSTVGLSLGITSSLSAASKGVIIAVMFIGRVSMLTLMIALFRKVKQQAYRYPTEEILIN